MTIGESLAEAAARLQPSPSARFDARALLESLLEKSGAWLHAHADDALETAVRVSFVLAVERRAGGEPVPYILGEAGFYARRFIVTPRVLVPRPESEGLVTLALQELRAAPRSAARLCDAGTGSGVLAVTLAAELPDATVTAFDVSPAALEVAERNARRHGVERRVRLVLGDVRDALPTIASYDGIIANLPYVRQADLAPAPDPTSFEPRLALDGGPDGLDVYRAFLGAASRALAKPGWLLMEAGPDTVRALAVLARDAFGPAATVWTEPDYAGLERIVGVRA